MAWWVIEDVQLEAMLQRARTGDDPALLLMELYANSDVSEVEGDA